MSGASRSNWLRRDAAPLPALALAFSAALAADRGWLDRSARRIVDDVRNDGPNVAESDSLTRDYYRELLGDGTEVRRSRLAAIARYWIAGDEEEFWQVKSFASDLFKPGTSFAMHEYLTDVTNSRDGIVIATNHFGMRDDPCEIEPAPGTLRIALVGASNDMGWGVAHEQCYEALLEQRLLEHFGANGPKRVEILNFSVAGYTLLEHVWSVEERVPAFRPHLVLVTLTATDLRNEAVLRLAQRVREGRDLRWDFVRDVVARSGGRADESLVELCRKIQPYDTLLIKGAFETLARDQRERPIPIALLALKLEPGSTVAPALRWAASAAESAGLPVLRIFDACADLSAREAQLDVRRDHHPSIEAHSRLADEICADLLADPRLGAIVTAPR